MAACMALGDEECGSVAMDYACVSSGASAVDTFTGGSSNWMMGSTSMSTQAPVAATVMTCGPWGDVLGTIDSSQSNVYLEKTYDLTAAAGHDELTVSMYFIALDSWDNEKAYVTLDGEQIWMWYGGDIWTLNYQENARLGLRDQEVVSTCGNSHNPDWRQHIRATAPHTGSSAFPVCLPACLLPTLRCQVEWRHLVRVQARVDVGVELKQRLDRRQIGVVNCAMQRGAPARVAPELKERVRACEPAGKIGELEDLIDLRVAALSRSRVDVAAGAHDRAQQVDVPNLVDHMRGQGQAKRVARGRWCAQPSLRRHGIGRGHPFKYVAPTSKDADHHRCHRAKLHHGLFE